MKTKYLVVIYLVSLGLFVASIWGSKLSLLSVFLIAFATWGFICLVRKNSRKASSKSVK